MTPSPTSTLDEQIAKVLMPPDVLARFERKYTPEPNSGCWLWTGSLSQGYGCIEHTRAHRISFEHFRHKIPDGLVLDHLCRVRCCVNPDHLEPVTNYTNIIRGFGAPAMNARKTHCVHGHSLEGDNLYTNADGNRICRKCRRSYQLASDQRRRDARGLRRYQRMPK